MKTDLFVRSWFYWWITLDRSGFHVWVWGYLEGFGSDPGLRGAGVIGMVKTRFRQAVMMGRPHWQQMGIVNTLTG